MVSKRMSLEFYEEHQKKVGKPIESAGAPTNKSKKTRGPDKSVRPINIVNKYGNQPCVVDGVRVPSKLEAKRYRELGLLLKSGEIHFLARQVRFILPGGIEYFADFVYGKVRRDDVFPENLTMERIVVEDVKSRGTMGIAKYRMKKRLMLSEYGIDIKEVGI